jgi:hypothetical protein
MARGNRKGKKRKSPTYQALSLFQINWSLRVGGHWRPKVRGWLHEGRVTEGGEGPGEVRPSVRLRHDRKWGGGGVLGKGEWNEEKGSPPGAFGIYNSSGRFLSALFPTANSNHGDNARHGKLKCACSSPRSGLGADASGGWRVYTGSCLVTYSIP